MLVVNEIFYSIQGESSYAGHHCVFIRLTYCNLRCSYCDTSYAFTEGKEMSIDDILNAIRKYDCRLIQVTGGEPLLQTEVHPLMKRLCDEGYEVLLETNGSIDISNTDQRVKRIMDFKCPSSGMVEKNLWKNVHFLKPGDEVKFVISNHEDYEWAKKVIKKYDLPDRSVVLMSVVFGALEPQQIVEWILHDKLSVRFQLQLHKYIWKPEMREV